jgi:threonine/homoserine/homoserine lactone efflux protein
VEKFTPFIIYVLVTTFTPGPNNITSMANAMRDGFRRTTVYILGIFCGFVLMMLASGFLNLTLINLLPGSHTWLNLLGAAYLIILAILIVLSKPGDDTHAGKSINTFWGGFIMTLLNVKVIIYGITVYSLFIIGQYNSAWGIAGFAFCLAFIAFISCTAWALGGHLFHRWLNRYFRVFNWIMAGLLVYTAVASLMH